MARHSPALILLPGGDANTGRIVTGKPGSGNFLSRSREEFQSAGFNVLVAYRPTDLQALDFAYRASAAHVAELKRIVAYARQRFGQPVWLVGTSRGTVSAAAAAVALGAGEVQGLVLTASVTSGRPGALNTQDLAQLKLAGCHRRAEARPAFSGAGRVPGSPPWRAAWPAG